MYIVAIAWIYVTLLMAFTEPSITAGVLTFSVYGLAPLALLLYLFGTPLRARRRAAERLAQPPEVTDPANHAPEATDPTTRH